MNPYHPPSQIPSVEKRPPRKPKRLKTMRRISFFVWVIVLTFLLIEFHKSTLHTASYDGHYEIVYIFDFLFMLGLGYVGVLRARRIGISGIWGSLVAIPFVGLIVAVILLISPQSKAPNEDELKSKDKTPGAISKNDSAKNLLKIVLDPIG
jgi:hypothetical protein